LGARCRPVTLKNTPLRPSHAPANSSRVPLFGGDLPYLRQPTPRHVVTLLSPDHPHALFFRDASRCSVVDGFRHAQHGKLQGIEPKVGDGVARFAHNPRALPGQAYPEATILLAP